MSTIMPGISGCHQDRIANEDVLSDVIPAMADVIVSIRDNCKISAKTIDTLAVIQKTPENRKKMLCGLFACGLAKREDVQEHFADGELEAV